MTAVDGTPAGRIQVNPSKMAWAPEWLGAFPDLYRPQLWQPADKIEVARFRQIYIWPLSLRLTRLPPPGEDIAAENLIDTAMAAARKTIEEDGKRWEEVPDLLDHVGASENDAAASYGEFVYFHDFIQALLYRPQPDGMHEPAIRLYRHRQIDGARITIKKRVFGAKITKRVFHARVDHCNLYLFRSGAAALAVELDFSDPTPIEEQEQKRALTLRDVEDFIDKARRSYTPYHTPGGHAGVVDEFVWLQGKKEFATPSVPDTLKTDLGQIKKPDRAGLRSAPMGRHWRDILAPLTIAGYEDEDKPLSVHNPVWRHVVDERIPVMSYVSLTGAAKKRNLTIKPAFEGQNPSAITGLYDLWTVSRGDWIRLAGADGYGPDPLPYSHRFLHDFESATCYDRYFPSDAGTGATRFMFMGYHFVAVGASNECDRDQYFDKVIVSHFRRHYFQMGLLLNMEFASLLATSSRLSEAVRQLMEDSKETAFRRTLFEIERDFLEFVHQFHFTGLSNQLQAREMFERWRAALGLDALFEDVQTEIASATGFLRSDRQVRQADAANALSVIASIAVFFGLVFAFLGMNVLAGENTLGELLKMQPEGWQNFFRQLFPFGLVLAATGLLWRWLLHRLLAAPGKSEDDEDRETRRRIDIVMAWAIGAGIVLGTIGLIAATWPNV
jgi:hypothetical protein